MKTIVFISCAKKKTDRSTIAEKMYISDFFLKSLEYAKKLNPDKIYILSAKYGLLELNDVIDPYEKTLNKMTEKDRMRWSQFVLKQMSQKGITFNERAIFLAGNHYRKYLMNYFKYSEAPLNSLSIGKQLSFMKGKIEE